jgi:hypothetical protein
VATAATAAPSPAKAGWGGIPVVSEGSFAAVT